MPKVEYTIPGVVSKDLTFLGFPGYRVGEDGSVWSSKRKGPVPKTLPKEVKWHRVRLQNYHGYSYAWMVGIDGEKMWMVHQLVLLAFIGPCPEGMECRHFPDNDRTNNHLSNLKYGTHLENCEDKKVHDTDPLGERNGRALLTESQVLTVRERTARGESQVAIAREMGIAATTVNHIHTRRIWKHI